MRPAPQLESWASVPITASCSVQSLTRRDVERVVVEVVANAVTARVRSAVVAVLESLEAGVSDLNPVRVRVANTWRVVRCRIGLRDDPVWRPSPEQCPCLAKLAL